MVDRVHNYGGNTKMQVMGIREAKTATGTSQEYGKLGDVKPLGMGKEVVFAQIGAAAIAAGLLCQGPAVVANHQNRAVAITASIGATEVTLSLGATSAAQDLYADGVLIVTCGTGSDYSYMIQGHNAWAASNTAAVVILKDALELALTTASICSLVQNPYKGVVVTGDCALLTGKIVGVTLVSAAASSFVYLGKKGEWPCKAIAANLVGGPAFHTTACTTGAVGPNVAGSDELVGVFTQTAVAGSKALVDFRL